MGTSALPDMYALSPVTPSFWHIYISHNVTLSRLRSKEITGIHMPCIPHSNDSSASTECKPW